MSEPEFLDLEEVLEIHAGILRSIERALEPCLGKGWLNR